MYTRCYVTRKQCKYSPICESTHTHCFCLTFAWLPMHIISSPLSPSVPLQPVNWFHLSHCVPQKPVHYNKSTDSVFPTTTSPLSPSVPQKTSPLNLSVPLCSSLKVEVPQQCIECKNHCEHFSFEHFDSLLSLVDHLFDLVSLMYC